MRFFSAFFVFFIFTSGCQFWPSLLKPVSEAEPDAMNVFLYTRPFPQEAERLRFAVEDIFAIKDDGMLFPMSVSLHKFEIGDMKRQRLVAAGNLPPGRYSGLSFKVRDASLEIEDGRASLLVPDKPVETYFPFVVSRGEAYVISLAFNYAGSIKEGVSFTPSFSAFFPRKPIADLSGFVANYNSDNIMVFDKEAKEITGVIATGRKPSGIALDRNLRMAFVTLSGDDSIEVIDIMEDRIINSIRLSTGDRPQEPAISPDGKILLTANPGSDTVSIIDPVAFFELKRIDVGDGPNSILVDRAGRRAYVFSSLSNTITVIDLASMSIAATISTDPGPLRGQFNRQGDKLYVIHESSSYMTVIDPFSLSILDRIYVGMGMRSIKLDTGTDLLYVGKKQDPRVEIYSPFNLIPIDAIETDGGVTHMTIDGDGNNLYLVIPDNKTLAVVGIVGNNTVSKIDVGEGPYWVTMMGEK